MESQNLLIVTFFITFTCFLFSKNKTNFIVNIIMGFFWGAFVAIILFLIKGKWYVESLYLLVNIYAVVGVFQKMKTFILFETKFSIDKSVDIKFEYDTNLTDEYYIRFILATYIRAVRLISRDGKVLLISYLNDLTENAKAISFEDAIEMINFNKLEESNFPKKSEDHFSNKLIGLNISKSTLEAKYSIGSSEVNLILSWLYIIKNVSTKLGERGKQKLIDELVSIDIKSTERMLYK